MADLDDFFAKKDRKKAKGKKFTTADEVAKKLEETGKRVEPKPKPKEKPVNPEGEELQHIEVKLRPCRSPLLSSSSSSSMTFPRFGTAVTVHGALPCCPACANAWSSRRRVQRVDGNEPR